jgi:hypothetical protein
MVFASLGCNVRMDSRAWLTDLSVVLWLEEGLCYLGIGCHDGAMP